MAGQILGDRYVVEQPLGQQTGRWTLLALDQQTQERVVIKLLVVDDQLDQDDLKLFEREVDTLKSLTHPAIPRYLDLFEQALPDGRAIALVRSHIEGKSLAQAMQRGTPFPEAKVVKLARSLLDILVYLHGQQPPVIHRDIKPSNILVSEWGVHLIDFGSVRTDSRMQTEAFTVVGTYGYMPPEQFLGRAVLASDLYSLGVTLTALMTALQPSALPHRGSEIDFDQMPQISPALADWLRWLTATDLGQRARSAKEALQALETGQRPTQMIPVAKPQGTPITLTKTAQAVEIQLPSMLGQTHLRIDAQRITWGTKRLGMAAGRSHSAPRAALQCLEYRDGRLILAAGAQRFELGDNPPLSARELEWLAYELSSWLQLPIQHAGAKIL
jgi:serine/threonine protein kinase